MKHLIQVLDENNRLDAFIAKKIPGISRSKVRRLIESGNVLVDGRVQKPRHRVSPGEKIALEIPPEPESVTKPQKIPLNIIYEDEHLMIVNKPAGMVTHPAETAKENTLVNALLGYTDKLSTINGPHRRGIIHRLDKDTTGVLIIARTDEAHLHLARQISGRKIKRIYRTLVMGSVEPEEGEINVPVGRHGTERVKMSVKFVNGREAVTLYKIIKKFRTGKEVFSYLKVSLKTGRTHQIRVHFSSIGHPVCGDPKYGRKSPYINMARQALHAEEAGFIHPASGESVSFRAPLPEDFRRQLEELEAAPD